MVGVAVPPGDPVGGRDDVDARLKHPDVEILVGEHAVECQHVRLGRDDLFDAAGRFDPVGRDTGQLAGVLADLVGRIAVHTNQFQVGPQRDASDHLRTDIAGRHLEYA